MSKRPEVNPDRVRYFNDKKQKKMTKLHLKQKIEYEKKLLLQEIEWEKRAKIRLEEHRQKIYVMELQLAQMP